MLFQMKCINKFHLKRCMDKQIQEQYRFIKYIRMLNPLNLHYILNFLKLMNNQPIIIQRMKVICYF